jgi:hypothetical protein
VASVAVDDAGETGSRDAVVWVDKLVIKDVFSAETKLTLSSLGKI